MKQEVRRGRKFIEYHDPDTQPEGTFTQEISGADVSYQDEIGNWHPADENWATDGVGGFVLKNDKLNHKIRLKGNGGRTWYPRRNVNTEYMTFGVPQYRNGNKWSNFSFSGWSVEGKTITLNTRQGVTILVHNRWDGIKIDWVLNNATAPSRMRYPVSLTGITYVDGIIYGADGTRLGQLTPTTATDANGAELVCSGSYANGYVEFQADVTGAVYPVTIDPDFAGSTADGQVYGQDADYATARSTSSAEVTNSSAIKTGQTTVYQVYRGYFMFDTSAITAGATVTQVNLKLTVETNSSTTDFVPLIVKYAGGASREIRFDNLLANDLDDGNFGSTGTGTWSANTQKTSGNLSTAWVNKIGTTYYGVVSEEDRNNSAPTASEVVEWYSANATTEAYRPILSVTYTAGGALRRINTSSFQQLTGGIHG